MQIAHEIAVNSEFKLEPKKPVEGSLYGKIKENMFKAYWDIIKEDIAKDPPVLDMVIKLGQDIRQMLLDLLLPHQNSLRQRINDIIDIDLIKQQCEAQGSIEPLRDYAPALLDLMQHMCCPMRDEAITALREVQGTIELFQGIMKVLQEMKLDFANFLIGQIRPLVKEHIVNYEADKFSGLELAQRAMGVEDPMKNTKEWLQRAYDDLYNVSQVKPSIGVTLLQGYMQAVFQQQYINEEWPLPETLTMDKDRVVKLQQGYLITEITSSLLLICQGYMPTMLATNQQFKTKLKETCIIVLKDVQCNVESELREALQDVAHKIFHDLQKEGAEGRATLSPKEEITFHAQVAEIANPDHPVRKVFLGRVLGFVSSMAKSGSDSVKVPPGLSALEPELTKLAADFIKIISLNRSTYADRYTSLLTDIGDSKRAQASIDLP